MRRVGWALLVLSLILIPTVVFLKQHWVQGRLKESLAQLRSGHPEKALDLAEDVLSHNRENLQAVRIAALAHQELGDFEKSASFFLRLPDGRNAARDVFRKAAEKSLGSGHLLKCSEQLQQVLQVDPDDAEAHRRLAAVFDACGRRWDAVPHHLAAISKMQFSLKELLLLGNPDEPWLDKEILPAATIACSSDPLVVLGNGYQQIAAERLQDATERIRTALRLSDGKCIECYALLGTTLFDQGELAQLKDWINSRPEKSDTHSEVWFAIGQWAQATNQPEAAVRCYWETLRRRPEKRRANFQIGQILKKLGRSEEAKPYLERAAQLTELHDLMRPVYASGAGADLMKDIAARLESIGRLWEAWAWNLAITRFAPSDNGAAESVVRLRKRLVPGATPQTLKEFNLALSSDFSGFPLPDWNRPDFSDRYSSASDHDDVEKSGLAFRDIAASAGIEFQYFNSDEPATEGKRMFETTGGGIATADFDGNGWPDLYFTQGCILPHSEQNQTFLDHFYRNLGNGRFVECARDAGLIDASFSQGASVGDINNDGFPDLYVANIGQNRLFRNNGDGTFEDIAVSEGIVGQHWTTSCAVADLDGDGMPEICDANYLAGKEALEVICGEDHKRTCSPLTFDPANQQIYQNMGDGSWTEVRTDSAGKPLLGKSLGIVAAKSSEGRFLDLFVANDGEANSFFQSGVSEKGQLMVEESAVISGLAFDRDGRPQACMGIAAEDANEDGLLDFFVTNYYLESNTLYLQQPGGIFLDGTRDAGLREPSFLMLGFGTQFLDGELDGHPDLVIANGHVDDFSYDGKPFHMRPQYFHNAGAGEFEEVRFTDSDSWFSSEYLGRGLARIDWNRDGREDFAVSQLDSPSVLVSNETAVTGHSISIRLIGTVCSRDAIGTVVSLNAGKNHRTRQLTAGDGYQASNERVLIFGLGSEIAATDIRIEWRSGMVQTLKQLTAGNEYVIVEGRSPISIPFNAARITADADDPVRP